MLNTIIINIYYFMITLIKIYWNISKIKFTWNFTFKLIVKIVEKVTKTKKIIRKNRFNIIKNSEKISINSKFIKKTVINLITIFTNNLETITNNRNIYILYCIYFWVEINCRNYKNYQKLKKQI
jgi:hypothetical protein